MTDLETEASLLYDLVETAHLKGEKIPNKVELMKTARLNLGIGLLEAKRSVDFMEDKYREDLKETGYFSH